jgi:hypothetical protein
MIPMNVRTRTEWNELTHEGERGKRTDEFIYTCIMNKGFFNFLYAEFNFHSS